MSTVIIAIKLMPESPQADLAKMKKEVSSCLEKEGAKNISTEEKPIAFSLKALYVKCRMPEEKGTESIEFLLSSIPEVSSVTIEEYRRAFG